MRTQIQYSPRTTDKSWRVYQPKCINKQDDKYQSDVNNVNNYYEKLQRFAKTVLGQIF